MAALDSLRKQLSGTSKKLDIKVKCILMAKWPFLVVTSILYSYVFRSRTLWGAHSGDSAE